MAEPRRELCFERQSQEEARLRRKAGGQKFCLETKKKKKNQSKAMEQKSGKTGRLEAPNKFLEKSIILTIPS